MCTYMIDKPTIIYWILNQYSTQNLPCFLSINIMQTQTVNPSIIAPIVIPSNFFKFFPWLLTATCYDRCRMRLIKTYKIDNSELT